MKKSLEEQRIEFANQKFLATPLAGLIVWTIIGVAGIFFSDFVAVWSIFIGTGSIVYLGLFLSKFTGENFLDKSKPKNEFDTLFLFTAGQAILVYSIAIPFFLVGLFFSSDDCRDFNRADVVALFMDNKALDRCFSFRNENRNYCGIMVSSTRLQIYSDTILHCFDIHLYHIYS